MAYHHFPYLLVIKHGVLENLSRKPSICPWNKGLKPVTCPLNESIDSFIGDVAIKASIESSGIFQPCLMTTLRVYSRIIPFHNHPINIPWIVISYQISLLILSNITIYKYHEYPIKIPWNPHEIHMKSPLKYPFVLDSWQVMSTDGSEVASRCDTGWIETHPLCCFAMENNHQQQTVNYKYVFLIMHFKF